MAFWIKKIINEKYQKDSLFREKKAEHLSIEINTSRGSFTEKHLAVVLSMINIDE